jgi:DNA polymerase-3 subunit beta
MTVATKAPPLAFTVPVDSMFGPAIKVGSIVPARGEKPIISNIRFSVNNGVLELEGTDLKAFLRHSIPAATITTSGSGLLAGSRLLEVLKEFRGAEATFVFDPRGGCRLTTTGNTYKLVGDDPRDFPTLARFDTDPGFQIKGSALVDMVNKTEFAAADEQTRYAIGGVNFELKGSRFRLAATDTKRIAVAQQTLQIPLRPDGQPEVADFSVVAPLSFFRLLKRVISKDLMESMVTIGVSGPYLFVRLPNAIVHTLLVAGRFPAYEEGFKAVLSKYIDCTVETFATLLKRAILVEAGKAVFEFSPNLLTLRSEMPTVGASSVSMPTPYTGEVTKIGFSPLFIKEALEVMTSERCRFAFDGPKKIATLKEIVVSADVAKGELVSDCFAYAIMPVVIPGEDRSAND